MADNFGLKIGLEGEKEFKKALAIQEGAGGHQPVLQSPRL